MSRHSDLLSFLPPYLLPSGLCVSASLREVILVAAQGRVWDLCASVVKIRVKQSQKAVVGGSR